MYAKQQSIVLSVSFCLVTLYSFLKTFGLMCLSYGIWWLYLWFYPMISLLKRQPLRLIFYKKDKIFVCVKFPQYELPLWWTNLAVNLDPECSLGATEYGSKIKFIVSSVFCNVAALSWNIFFLCCNYEGLCCYYQVTKCFNISIYLLLQSKQCQIL